MTMARAEVTAAFLIHARPYRETDKLCELFTEKFGRIRCRMSARTPEAYRQFELKLTDSTALQSVTGFRYTQPVLIDSNQARMMAFYVNELLYRLLPAGHSDSSLFGRYVSTLLYLNQQTTVSAVLRYWEQGLLTANGQAVDYFRDASNMPINPQQRYRFQCQTGFVPDSQGRYPGELLRAIAKLDFSAPGALSVARECQRMQIDQLLQGRKLCSRDWSLGLSENTGDSSS